MLCNGWVAIITVRDETTLLELWPEDRPGRVLGPYGTHVVEEFLHFIIRTFWGGDVFDTLARDFCVLPHLATIFGFCNDSASAKRFFSPDAVATCIVFGAQGVKIFYQFPPERRRITGKRVLVGLLELFWVLFVQSKGTCISKYFGSYFFLKNNQSCPNKLGCITPLV